jgi:hypothetical protein
LSEKPGGFFDSQKKSPADLSAGDFLWGFFTR